MVVDLTKGGKVNLEKEAPGMRVGKFGLGWDINPSANGQPFDLDRFVILLGEDSKAAIGDGSLIFYGHPVDEAGSVEMSPDNRTGEGSGYDETCTITFEKVPSTVKEIIVGVSIYDYENRGNQNFGQVNSAMIDVLNGDTNEKLTHTDLSEDLSMETGAVVGRFRREADNTWSFKALAETYRNGMKEILTHYGINV